MRAKDYLLMGFISKKEASFYVPPYQRNYKWQQKKEIKTLINDIENFMLEKKRDGYFLGSIVVKKKEGSRADYIIIDGQQRITTLFLLCKALADVATAPNLKVRANVVLESNETKFKFNRRDDICTLIRILNDNNFLSKQEKESNYFQVYKFFKDFFGRKLEQELDDFFNEGIANIKVAVIELEQYEDEFSVYESINSKGKKLSNNELIKNYVMMVLEQNSKLEWRELFETKFLDKIDEKSLEDLYRQTIAIKTGELFSKSNNSLYYAWKKNYPKPKVDKPLIEDLIYDQEIYNFIKNHRWGSKSLPLVEAALMNFYAIIHFTVKANSEFAHYNLEITNVNLETIEYVVNYLSKLVVARMLYGFGRVESNRTYAKMALHLKKEAQDNDFKAAFDKAVVQTLKQASTNARMPKLNEIKDGIGRRSVKSNQNVLKWTLIALEQMTSGQKWGALDKVYIKNIFPEKPSDTWKQKLSKSELNQGQELVNTLGNLTIAKSSVPAWNKNPENMNLFRDKKADFKINQIIYKEKWTHTAIKNRTRQLQKEIIKTWKIGEN